MKSLTIITNFEGSEVGIPLTALSSLDMLKDAAKFEKVTNIRVIGGSDPLYEIEKHTKYYERLFRICRDLHMPLELQTSRVDSGFPYGRCGSVTYVVDNFDKLTKIIRHGHEWVRVDFIVGKSCTLDLIDKVAAYYQSCCTINDLCFRAHKGSHLPKNCREYLRIGDPGRWTFVEEGSEDSYAPFFVNGEIRYHWSDIFE